MLALKPCNRTHRERLVLNIPDTIIYNQKNSPSIWVFTDQKGEVCRTDDPSPQQIVQKLTKNCLDKELVAVVKKPQFGLGGPVGNEIRMVSTAEVKLALTSIQNNRSEVCAIQRFVKSSSVKASVMRTCWRLKGSHEGWILTSQYPYDSTDKVNEINKLIVNTKINSCFTAVRCSSEKHLNKTLVYNQRIVKFLEHYLGIVFEELVADYVRDEGDNWWFINLKAFVLQTPNPKVDIQPIFNHDDQPVDRKKLQSYTKCKKCRFCYKVMAEHLLSHTLTLMMILQTDLTLIRLGKTLPWLERCFKQHISSVNLYVQHKVCDSCFKLYKEIQGLTELQTELALKTGVRVVPDNPNLVSVTAIPHFKGRPPEFGSRLQKIKYDPNLPNGLNLDHLNQGLKRQPARQLKKCRMMIFMHSLYDIPTAACQYGKSIAIKYGLLGEYISYTIPFDRFEPQQQRANDSHDLSKMTLRKMKTLYFFCQNRDQIVNFLKTKSPLKIGLWRETSLVGQFSLELNEFRSDKVVRRDFVKMLAGENVFPYLSWSLHVTVGLHEGDLMDPSQLRLVNHHGLWLAQTSQHSYDPLPYEWVQMIQERPDIDQSEQVSRQKTEQSPQKTNKTDPFLYLTDELSSYATKETPKRPMTARRRPHY